MSTDSAAASGHRSSLSERAALVALVNRRPGGRSWPELTALVLERAQIEALLEDLDPAALFPSPEQIEARAEAEAQVKGWEAEGLAFLTILDDRYPASVREIHQAPPFLFAAGELRASDPAVSVVGSREASETSWSPTEAGICATPSGAVPPRARTVLVSRAIPSIPPATCVA